MPWALIAEQLRQRPGEWAVVQEGSVDLSTANRISTGRYVWFKPAGAFEATLRSGGTPRIYARYVGSAS